VSATRDGHRLIEATPVASGTFRGMNWRCTCDAIGWCAADIAEAVWYDHVTGRDKLPYATVRITRSELEASWAQALGLA